MTDSGSAGQTELQADRHYRRARAHFQAGEWQEAIATFEVLRRQYPANEELDRFIEEARFKADLDTGPRVKGRRWAIPWRPLITGTLIILVTIALGLVVTGVVTQQILPTLAESREESERAQLLADARAYLEAGELEAAQSRYSALLDRVPGHPEALAALSQIAEQRLLRDLYQQGVAFQEAGNFSEARRLYSEIRHLAPGYRDVEERLREVQRRQEIHDLFAQAEAAYDAGERREALSLYERVREMNVSYEREHIDGRLFELYMHVGRQIVDAPQEDQLQRALSYFARSLSLRPASRDAAVEHRLAIVCSEGLSAFGNQVWGTAIARLRTVYEERPQYLGGIVVERLYLAYVRLGEQYEQAGNLPLAYEQYERAMALPVDVTLASSLATELAPLLTPTPRPTPLPAAVAEPTRVPFVGREPQDENLLTNPSFEEGWYDIYTGQVPEGWRLFWLDGVEFPGSADVALAPETIVGQRARTPARERDLLFQDGTQHLKVFKGMAPMYAAVLQDVSGLDVGRSYRLTAPVFVDTYIWDGGKVAPGGESARIRLGASPRGAVWRDEQAINYSEWWDGNNTSDFFFRYIEFEFEFEATEPEMTIYIEMAAIWGLNNNGFFIDDVSLNPLGSR